MSTTTEIPNELKYTREHEWIRSMDGGEVEVGITAFAAGQLGDVVFVELPEVGARVTAGEPFGVVESVKSVSDLFAPLTGEVTARNDELMESPEQVNDASYGAGWMIRIKPDDADAVAALLTADGYAAFLQESGA